MKKTIAFGMAFVMLAVIFAAMPSGVASPGGLIFHAHFDSDTVDAPPDTTLPGPPAGDSIVLDLGVGPGANGTAGYIMVRSAVGDLTNQPVEVVKTGGIGGVKMYGTVAGTPPTSGVWYASWRGLVQSGSGPYIFGPMVFRDSSSLILAAVAYRENGTIDFNDQFMYSGIGVSWTPDVSQFFELTIDLDTKITSLSIDGTPVALCQNMNYYQANASDLAHMNFEVGYTTYQAYALDDMKITSDVIDATIDIDPDTLNLKSGGKWITCYIELDGYNVSDIDISTVKITDIEGVSVDIPAESHPTSVGDEDSDGIPDLMVKFDRSDVQDACSVGPATFTVTGELTDGTVFEGYDTINVINPP